MASKLGVSAPRGHKERAASEGPPAKPARRPRKPRLSMTYEQFLADPIGALDLPRERYEELADREMREQAEREHERLLECAERRDARNAARRAQRSEERGGRPSRRGGARPGAGRKPGPRTLARRAALAHVFL